MVSIDYTVCRCPVETSFNITRKQVYRDQFSDDEPDTPYLLACAANEFIDSIIQCWEQSNDSDKVEEFLSTIKYHCEHHRRDY